MRVGLEHYLVVSFLLFALGLLGVVMRRNLLVIYMSLELMLNAANLALVSFSRFNDKLDGQVLVFFIITVAAAEVAVGLALIVALYRKRQTAHVEDLTAEYIHFYISYTFFLDETLTDEIRNLPWLTLFLPIFSAAAITLFTLKHRNVSALLSVGAIVAGFVMTLVFIGANGFHINAESPGVGHAGNWLSIGDLQIDFGLKLDALSLMMMLVVTGVGGAIHIYSCRLHARRQRLLALLRVLEPVHLLDARHRAGQQFHRDVHLLGTGRRVQLPAHRVLV